MTVAPTDARDAPAVCVLVAAGVAEAVSEDVDGAALSGAAEDLRDRRLQALLGRRAPRLELIPPAPGLSGHERFLQDIEAAFPAWNVLDEEMLDVTDTPGWVRKRDPVSCSSVANELMGTRGASGTAPTPCCQLLELLDPDGYRCR